jgi:hypothetical protein
VSFDSSQQAEYNATWKKCVCELGLFTFLFD